MATAVVDLAKRYGCVVKRAEGGTHPGPRAIQVHISAPGGLCVTVGFNGMSRQPDVHVLSWHMDIDQDAKLEPSTFGGSVNPFHFRKATYVARGFDELMFQLEAGLSMCQDGTAYQQPALAAA